MNLDHSGSVDEIAKAAAAAYGQDWSKIPTWSRDKWREVVRHAQAGTVGETKQDQCAIKAVEDWIKAQQPKVVEAPPQGAAKPKKNGK